MKRKIDPFDYAGRICKALPKGVLLTTKVDGKVNTMTIGWGMIGIEWGKPVFIAFVRESRYTKQLLEKNGEFTVNIPVEEGTGKIMGYCGSKSGRSVDKITELGLTLVDSEAISAPAIRELPLTLECKVIYRQKQELSALSQEVLDKYYPVSADNEALPQDYHIAYYGEIVASYLLED